MKLWEVLDSESDDDVIVERLVTLYPDMENSKKGYYKVIDALRNMMPEKSWLEIRVETVFDDFEGDYYVHVSGYDKEEEEDLAIEYTPWNQWLGMKVLTSSLNEFSKLDILCHCLWEMTWSGFEEEQIQNEFEEITGRMREAVDASRNEKGNTDN